MNVTPLTNIFRDPQTNVITFANIIHTFHDPQTNVTTFTNIIHDAQMNVTPFTNASAVLLICKPVYIYSQALYIFVTSIVFVCGFLRLS